MKRCSCCRKFKPESEFQKNKNSKDGLQNCCRECNYLLNAEHSDLLRGKCLSERVEELKEGGFLIEVFNEANTIN